MAGSCFLTAVNCPSFSCKPVDESYLEFKPVLSKYADMFPALHPVTPSIADLELLCFSATCGSRVCGCL